MYLLHVYFRDQNRMPVASPPPAQRNPNLFCFIPYIRKDSPMTVLRPKRDTLRRLFLYCWEGWAFPRERGWDEWVSIVFIETPCNISQGINRTMECWQKGWFFCNCGNPAIFPGTIFIVYLHLNFNKQGSCCLLMNFQMEIYFPLLSPSCESGPILQICSWVHREH